MFFILVIMAIIIAAIYDIVNNPIKDDPNANIVIKKYNKAKRGTIMNFIRTPVHKTPKVKKSRKDRRH